MAFQTCYLSNAVDMFMCIVINVLTELRRINFAKSITTSSSLYHSTVEFSILIGQEVLVTFL